MWSWGGGLWRWSGAKDLVHQLDFNKKQRGQAQWSEALTKGGVLCKGEKLIFKLRRVSSSFINCLPQITLVNLGIEI